MNELHAFIQKLRTYPEPRRRRFFWLSFISLCAVIGMLWIVTLPWQLSRASYKNGGMESATAAGNLPTIGESVNNAGASVGDAVRDFLRQILLGNDRVPPDNPDNSPQSDTQPAPRLPHSE